MYSKTSDTKGEPPDEQYLCMSRHSRTFRTDGEYREGGRSKTEGERGIKKEILIRKRKILHFNKKCVRPQCSGQKIGMATWYHKYHRFPTGLVEMKFAADSKFCKAVCGNHMS